MSQQERDVNQCRKLLLDFYSSELSTHSRLIIGFTVILLTLLQITWNLRESISLAQFRIVYFGISLVAFALWYLLMRHFAYGILANAAIHAVPSENQEHSILRRMTDGVRRHALKKRILVVIPMCLFYSTGTEISWLQRVIGVAGARLLGLLLCTFLAIFTTHLMMILVGLVA